MFSLALVAPACVAFLKPPAAGWERTSLSGSGAEERGSCLQARRRALAPEAADSLHTDLHCWPL